MLSFFLSFFSFHLLLHKSARFRPGTESSITTKTRRSQHKNHHHHYQQPQKQQDETVTAASVNHQHHLPPVIKNAIALTATTTKKRNNNHKHLKHSGAGTVAHNKDPVFTHFPDEMNFLLSNNNNFNRINNDNDSDDDEDEENYENFAETRNNNDEDEERRERDRQKDKVQFDLPNKDYVDFDTVMQNSASPSKLRDDKSNRRRVSKNYDDEDDEDEIESGDSSEESDRDEKLKRKTTVITQFPSEIIVSAIEKEDAEIGKQQQQRRQQRQEYRKGSKLLEKRHKINDEGNFLFACSFTPVFYFSGKMY